MEYCRLHLSQIKKKSRAGTIVLLVLGGIFAVFGLLLMAALTTAEDVTVGIQLLAAVIFVLPGAVMLFFGWKQMKANKSAKNPEDSKLVQAIRRQLPPEQAELPLEEIFAVVDRDLDGGQSFGKDIIIGREWVLISDFAVQISRIRGIFMQIYAHRTQYTYASSYQFTVYDDVKEKGTAVLLLDRGKASACLDALCAAAPWAMRGGMEAEVKLLGIPEEQFAQWNRELARQQAERNL